MQLKKYADNPILVPTGEGDWEAIQVCNPGAVLRDGKVYMLYRASAESHDYRIHMGLAVSEDGYTFERASDRPIYNPQQQFEAGCVEDPRIVEFDGYYYITYACRAVPYTQFMEGRGPKFPDDASRCFKEDLTRTGLLRTRDFREYECLGPITGDDVDDRDVVIFPEKVNGRYVMLRRPMDWVGPEYGCDAPSIWMAFSDDLLTWKDDVLLATADLDAPWQGTKIGGSTPPIKTDRGWLMMYHGVEGANETRVYRQGVMMLDLEDPTKIISRPKGFILEPTADFEVNGLEHDVVFATANVVIGDEVFVYYGGADTVVCLATAKLDELIDYAMSCPTGN